MARLNARSKTQDLFAVCPEKLPATESVLTLIGGEIVYGSLPLTQ